MKKRLLISILIIGLTIVIGWLVIVRIGNESEWKSVDNCIKILNDELCPEVFVFGEEYDFRKGFNYKRLNEITTESLAGFSQSYKVLILMDINGDMHISDEELFIIKECCENYGMDMYYLGKKHLDDFLRLEFSYEIGDDELSFQYLGSLFYKKTAPTTAYCNWYASHGLFRTSYGDIQDNLLLQTFLLDELVDRAEKFMDTLDNT